MAPEIKSNRMFLGWQEAHEQVHIGLWKIEEPAAYFLERLSLRPQQRQQLQNWHPKRGLEWLASRYLLHLWRADAHLHLEKDACGKPFLKDGAYYLSISHSDGFAAIAIAPKNLGLDIQIRSPQIARVAPKFLSKKEQATAIGSHRDMQLHAYWCAKEALYKAYGKKRLDFRKEIQVQPFSYDQLDAYAEGCVHKKTEKQRYRIYYQEIEDHLLCYVVPQ